MIEGATKRWRRFREGRALRLEYWEGNSYYGIGGILRRYAGLPFWFPLNHRIQHGIKFFNRYSTLEPLREQVAFYISDKADCQFLMYSEDHAEFFRRHGIENVRVIGSPVLYMDEYVRSLNAGVRERRGTIAFPAKGTQYVESRTDYREYAQMLDALPDKFKPIKVCMYYLDMERGNGEPFAQKGFELVSNGSLLSQAFLHEFFKNSASCAYATSNDLLSSPVYYSIYGGAKFFRYGPKIKHRSLGDFHKEYAREREMADEICPYQFPFEMCDDYARQKEIADRELGAGSKLTREALRALIVGAVSVPFLKDYVWTVAPRFKIASAVLEAYDRCHDKVNQVVQRRRKGGESPPDERRAS